MYLAKERELDGEKELKLLKSIINSLPDMLWAKSIDGSYIYANKAIIDGLLFSGTLENTINRRDVEMAMERKKVVGDENHTFGEICGNSDYAILETENSERFLEFGKINGEDLYLEVYKDILKDKNGNIIGTVGTGRDITTDFKDFENLIEEIDNLPKNEIKEKLSEIVHRHFYTGKSKKETDSKES